MVASLTGAYGLSLLRKAVETHQIVPIMYLHSGSPSTTACGLQVSEAPTGGRQWGLVNPSTREVLGGTPVTTFIGHQEVWPWPWPCEEHNIWSPVLAAVLSRHFNFVPLFS